MPLSDEIIQEKEKKPNEDYNNGALNIIFNRQFISGNVCARVWVRWQASSSRDRNHFMVLLGSVANGSAVICLADKGLAHTCYGRGYTRTTNDFLLVVSKYIVSWYRPNLIGTNLAVYDAEFAVKPSWLFKIEISYVAAIYLLMHQLR